MFKEAEAEFVRARSIADPSDPALHNAAYGMFGQDHERNPAFAGVRVEEARARARASYARMTAHELLPLAVQQVIDAGKLLGAAEGRKRAKLVAETFPDLARAQYLHAYMDLEFVRSLDESIDKRPFLRRTLAITERAARDFPDSPVLAGFYAKLLFLLGEYHAAERECRRSLAMKDPDDPQHDCIPPGSIGGEHSGARLVSLACEFHEMINNILVVASDYWESMSSESQRGRFLRISFGALEDEYRKVDRSYAFSMSEVQSFVKEHSSWRYWACAICDRKKFMDTGSLLSHMCSKHPRAALPRLQSILDPKLSDEALQDEVDGFTFCEDQQDMICFKRDCGVFRWLFYAPSSGVGPRSIPDIKEKKREKGRMVLESIKEKMKTLPADRSSAEFAEALPKIQEKWNDFLKYSAFDYRGPVLTLARSYLWRELKKCMTEDPELAAKKITLADIDAVFTKKVDKLVNADGDHETGDINQSSQTNGAPMDSEDYQESANITESSYPASSVAESENELVAKLDKLKIDSKESEVHDENESSEAPTKNTDSSDLTINMAESRNDQDIRIEPDLSDTNQESEVQVEESSDQLTNMGESGNDLDRAGIPAD
ncbi:hypothetical protein BS78_05G192400 [Paspalum vaginatum]|nr:hypothetical protein BS78_05G192400 [Paspalum vaginatum]